MRSDPKALSTHLEASAKARETSPLLVPVGQSRELEQWKDREEDQGLVGRNSPRKCCSGPCWGRQGLRHPPIQRRNANPAHTRPCTLTYDRISSKIVSTHRGPLHPCHQAFLTELS